MKSSARASSSSFNVRGNSLDDIRYRPENIVPSMFGAAIRVPNSNSLNLRASLPGDNLSSRRNRRPSQVTDYRAPKGSGKPVIQQIINHPDTPTKLCTKITPPYTLAEFQLHHIIQTDKSNQNNQFYYTFFKHLCTLFQLLLHNYNYVNLKTFFAI